MVKWLLVLGLAGLVACDDGGAAAADAAGGAGGAGGVGGAGGGAGGAGGAGGTGGAPGLEVIIDQAGTPLVLADGATVPYVWGFQGGTMIQPAVLLPAAAVEGQSEIRVTLRHRPDPADPEAFGGVGEFESLVLDLPIDAYDATHRIVGPIDDQIGWTDLGGVRLILEVSVAGPTVNSTTQYALTIAGQAGPCDGFLQTGMGCTYREINGFFQVQALEAVPGCGDHVVPQVAFEAAAADGTACIADLGFDVLVGRTLPLAGLEGGADRACLERHGVTVGGNVPGVVSVEDHGTCGPVSLAPDTASLAECQTPCP